MKMKRLHIAALVSASLILLMSYSANPPQRSTGAPGEETCARPECHSRGSARSGSFDISGLPDIVMPGTTYDLTVELTRSISSLRRGGFQMTILDDSELSAGEFTEPGEGATTSRTAGRQYAEHQPAQTFSDDNMIKYMVRWTAPSDASSDQLILYAAANLANGNGNRSGDNVFTIEKEFAIVTDPNLTVSAIISDPSCAADNGSISLAVSGGVPPYIYSWVTDDETAMLSDVPAGSYAVTISDQSGATLDTTFMLIDGPDEDPPRWESTDTLRISSCVPFSYPLPRAIDDCDGEVQALLISGSGPGESYSLGMSQDVYVASDSSGNTSEHIVTIINNAPISLDIMVLDIACHDDPAGSVQVAIDGENDPYDVSIKGGIYTVDSLPVGDHEVLIRDATGCEYTEQISIHRPEALSIDTIIVRDANTSASGDGSLTPQVRGGTGSYTYQWYTEGEEFSAEAIISSLFPGEYVLTVMDENGCSVTSDTVIVDVITSVVEITASSQIFIYPTITTDQFIIDNGTDLKIRSVSAVSIDGQIVEVNNSLGQLPDGMYIIRVAMSDETIYWRRVLKVSP